MTGMLRREKSLGHLTNNSGGIQGGLSNGEPILFGWPSSRGDHRVCPNHVRLGCKECELKSAWTA